MYRPGVMPNAARNASMNALGRAVRLVRVRDAGRDPHGAVRRHHPGAAAGGDLEDAADQVRQLVHVVVVPLDALPVDQLADRRADQEAAGYRHGTTSSRTVGLTSRPGTAAGVTLGLGVSIGGLFAPLLGLAAQHLGPQGVFAIPCGAPPAAWLLGLLLTEPEARVMAEAGPGVEPRPSGPGRSRAEVSRAGAERGRG
jgi:hypothetical protein